MKRLVLVLIMTLATLSPLHAADLRTAYQQALVDHRTAVTEQQQSTQRITTDRTALEAEIRRLKKEVTGLRAEVTGLKKELKVADTDLARIIPLRDRVETDLGELSMSVRLSARDLEGVLADSLFSALDPARLERLAPIAGDRHFPGMDELRLLSDLCFTEMEHCREVDVTRATFVARDGGNREADILTVGPFTAAWSADGKTGLLAHATGSAELVQLSADEPRRLRRTLKRYLNGQSDAVCLDFSSGAALRQLTERPTLGRQIERGGPLVWPIMLLALVALGLGLERFVVLRRIHQDTDRLMGSMNEHASAGRWTDCEQLAASAPAGPVTNILRSGLASRKESRETLESILEEAILRELPALERFLPTINILGAIAPLLGLLGTVTGMIQTFHVITLYGTGDPRIMSGGISEALITTEFGLAVAIPIMLMHTLLTRKVDHLTSDMEEKAVALSNLIFTNRR